MNKDVKLRELPFDSAAYKAFLLMKAQTHNYMKYYADVDVIGSIINEKALRLSDGRGWNDIQDSNSFKSSNEYLQFGKCFSFSRSESVAMWFIYGRNPDKACMIDFKSSVRKIVQETEHIKIYYHSKEGNFNEKELTKDQYNIFICDALYINEKEDEKMTIKWYDQTVDDVPSEIIYNLDGLWKTMPWAYECECRLIIQVDKSIVGNAMYNTAEILLSDGILNNIRNNILTGPYFKQKNSLGFATKPSKLRGNIAFTRTEG